MDCRGFIAGLDDFLEGRSSADEMLAAAEHLERCPACRRLSSVLDDRAALRPPPDLVDAVLARTSGATCGSARDRLCAFVDGRLEPVDAGLVGAHLDGCEDCSTLARVLARLGRDLSSLAETMPDRSFVREVVARTAGRRRPVARRAGPIIEKWRAWARRPRFALEAAYVGMFVLVLLFRIPTLAGAPRKALDLVTINPVAQVEEPLTGLERQLSAGVRTAWLAANDGVSVASREVADGSAQLLVAARARLGTFWQRLASGQETDDTENATDEASSLEDQGDSR